MAKMSSEPYITVQLPPAPSQPWSVFTKGSFGKDPKLLPIACFSLIRNGELE